MIEGFRSMAATVCVGVRAMMDRAVAENSSLIIDGVSLVPGLIDLASYQDRAHVIFLIVATFCRFNAWLFGGLHVPPRATAVSSMPSTMRASKA